MENTKENTQEQEQNNLGNYGNSEATEKLSYEQILGIGGGTEFFEILDCEGKAKKHVAMPCLLRDRPVIKDLLKAHAQNMIEIQKVIEESKKEEAENGTTAEKLESIEEADIALLLKTAYYLFKRTDSNLKGKTLEEGVEIISQWMDISQLRRMPQVAMGLNRFNPQFGAASLM